ncbi:MAG: hypothetical protein FWG68_12830 [Defluviitaleaceae bacterium]|nr:hypothetical protein [Defluviitaleaceae bacterium]
MNAVAQIHDIAERLDKPEQELVLALMKRLLPDYIATAEDIADIAKAREEYAQGKTVNFDNLDWD